jgi:Flp pilus assembly protein TadG
MALARSPYRRARRRRGAAALEFALVLPLLITIVLGCVDFGRFAYTYIAVTNAARVGAGFGSSKPFTLVTRSIWQQQIRQAVVNEMGTPFESAEITMPAPVVTTESGGLKRVHVEVSYPFRTLVTWPGIPNDMTLTRAVEMRVIH